jgi:hypothetical protein
VGQAYRFITNLNTVEWMEFRPLHDDARVALEAAAKNAILSAQATNALRALFLRATSLTRKLDGHRSRIDLRCALYLNSC